VALVGAVILASLALVSTVLSILAAVGMHGLLKQQAERLDRTERAFAGRLDWLEPKFGEHVRLSAERAALVERLADTATQIHQNTVSLEQRWLADHVALHALLRALNCTITEPTVTKH
jgi:uncharacterized protein HemX